MPAPRAQLRKRAPIALLSVVFLTACAAVLSGRLSAAPRAQSPAGPRAVAASLCADGQDAYRSGDFGRALGLFSSALQANPDLACAHLGAGRVLVSEFRFRSARGHFEAAYRLAPNDPEVLVGWAVTRRDPTERIEALKKQLAMSQESPLALAVARAHIELTKKLGNRPAFALSHPPSLTRIRLELLRREDVAVAGLGIKAAFNEGPAVKLLLDTGASGILLNRKDAEKSGVELIASYLMGGIGDAGAHATSAGLARVVRIADVEFHDCPVDVTDQKFLPGIAGTMGVDVFRDFLVTLDYPRQILDLALISNSTEAARGEAARWDHDREAVSDHASFTAVRTAGNFLLLPVKVNQRKEFWFGLDSGANSTMLDAGLAGELPGTTTAEGVSVAGLSGKARKVLAAHRVTLEFGGLRETYSELLAVDFAAISNASGTRVSGILGQQTLENLTLVIDYRNGLVKFIRKR